MGKLMIELPRPHSPLGASGASRWMKCPGSVGLSQGVDDPESDYAAEGTAAHAVGAVALGTSSDAWSYIGTTLQDSQYDARGGIEITKEMADAVQVYLDRVRLEHPDRNQGNTWVERSFHCPDLHELFYGTADLIHLDGETLHVWDYKHGAGIVVEVENNPQLMYYAVGALHELMLWNRVKKVVLHVAQPRGFHWDGPIREWSISTPELWTWQRNVLVPAMNRAMTSTDTASGDHCRFCPARWNACPQLLADAEEAWRFVAMIEKSGAPALTNEQVGRLLDLHETLKIAAKAARETGFARAQKGATIPGWKLGKARSNREWKEEIEEGGKKIKIEELARSMFGEDAFSKPALLSPAQLEGLPKGKAFTTSYAYKPDKGLQLVPEGDSRPEAGPAARSMFQPAEKKSRRKKGA